MYKMIALFKKNQRTQQASMTIISNTHMPLTNKIPGLEKVEITRCQVQVPII